MTKIRFAGYLHLFILTLLNLTFRELLTGYHTPVDGKVCEEIKLSSKSEQDYSLNFISDFDCSLSPRCDISIY